MMETVLNIIAGIVNMAGLIANLVLARKLGISKAQARADELSDRIEEKLEKRVAQLEEDSAHKETEITALKKENEDLRTVIYFQVQIFSTIIGDTYGDKDEEIVRQFRALAERLDRRHSVSAISEG
jgi:predicted nuclease with TOPRIM domain